MVIERVMFWAIVVLCVLVVVLISSAVLVRTRDSDPRKEEDDKHFWASLVNWVTNASTCVKVGRVIFLVAMLFAFVDLAIIFFCTLISAFQSHSSWFTGTLNVVCVLFGAGEGVGLFLLRGKAHIDYSLWIYAWFLMFTIVLAVAVACTYFDGKAGLDSADSLMPGVLVLLTAVITTVNLLLYIHDLLKGAGVECLRWFKRTWIFEVITVVFVVAVIFKPFLERYAGFTMVFEVSFTIATWEYLKQILDERIIPARQ